MGVVLHRREFGKRKQLAAALKKFYNDASSVVHGGELSAAKSTQIEKIQTICHRAILKILQDGPPDLNKLTLG